MSCWLLYIFILPLLCFLFRKSKYKFIPFAIITLLGMFRYDLVSDYSMYLEAFLDIRDFGYKSIPFIIQHFEIGYIGLNILFSYIPNGWIILFALCALFIYSSIYKELKRENIIIFGTFIFIILGYINRFDNIIRQALAMSLFIYSIHKYIEKGKFFQFIFIIIIASLFHKSALFTIAFYPLIRHIHKINIPVNKGFILLLLISLLTITGIINHIFIFLSDLINYRDQNIEHETIVQNNTGLGVLLYMLILYIPYYGYMKYPYKKEKTHEQIFKMYYVYVLLVIASYNVELIRRVVEYIVIYAIIAISIYYTQYRRSSSVLSNICILYLYISFSIKTINYYGESNYQTVLSSTAKELKVYLRGNSNINQEQDRNYTYKLR